MTTTIPLLAKLRDAQVAVINEQVDNSRWQMLRSLPAIHYLGVDQFTYPTSWRQLDGGRQYDYLDYTYRHLNEIDEIGNDAPPFSVITNRHYEEDTPYSVRTLVEQYTISDGPLVVVSDSREFTPEGGQRPLDQEQFATRIGSYDRLYDAFEERYETAGFTLPLRDTKNLFVQDNANLYEVVVGDTLTTVRELFEVLPETPYLPLYDVFGEMFGRPKEFGSVPLDSEAEIEALGKWLRRRIEWDRGTGLAVARELNQAVVDSSRTFDPSYAPRSPLMANAEQAAHELDSDASPIHARYTDWLTRY